MAETCETCRFWQRGHRSTAKETYGQMVVSPAPHDVWGTCRRRSPNNDGDFGSSHQADWCGEREP